MNFKALAAAAAVAVCCIGNPANADMRSQFETQQNEAAEELAYCFRLYEKAEFIAGRDPNYDRSDAHWENYMKNSPRYLIGEGQLYLVEVFNSFGERSDCVYHYFGPMGQEHADKVIPNLRRVALYHIEGDNLVGYHRDKYGNVTRSIMAHRIRL